MKENTMKAAAAVSLAGMAAYFHMLLVPLIVVLIAMLLDYASGVASAWIHNELSSRTGVVGIIKKLAYILIIAVAMVVDWIIRSGADELGINVGNFYYFALLVVFWITANECISILENVGRMGVPVPEFLVKIIKKLKQNTEKKGEEQSGLADHGNDKNTGGETQ